MADPLYLCYIVAMSKRINSRTKGKVGELEIAKLLTEHGYPARRGRQYCGNPDAPDVVCPSLPLHLEVKRRESLSGLLEWIDKARFDAGADVPGVVIHRKNGTPWTISMALDEFLRYIAPKIKL